MRRTVVVPLLLAAALLLTVAPGVSRAQAPSAPETFTATATVRTAAGPTVTAPVVITVTRWTTDAERITAINALKSGGSAAVKKAIEAMPDAGTIQVGQRNPITLKYARVLPVGSGRLVNVLAPQPIVYLGEGAPGAKPKAGFDLALASFQLDAAGKGTGPGELAPAATLKVSPENALVVEDYGAEAVRLTGVAKK